MTHVDDDSDVLTVRPSLSQREVGVVAGLAGTGPGPRRVWPGQPGRRSPWLPCPVGCCLVLDPRVGADPVEWLRFLVRELLAPEARQARERAAACGLPGAHRVEGRVLLGGLVRPRLVVVAGRRVRVLALDEDLFPVERPSRRQRGEVVELADRLGTADERTRAARGQSTER